MPVPVDSNITFETDMLLQVQFILQASSVKLSACLACQIVNSLQGMVSNKRVKKCYFDNEIQALT